MALSKQEIVERVATRIKRGRAEVRGMSQAELSRRTGASTSAVLRWEKGTNEIPLHQLMKVADALDLDLSYFLQDLSENIKMGQETEGAWLPVGEQGDRAQMSVRLKDLVEQVECCEIYVGVSHPRQSDEKQTVRDSA